MSDLPGGSTGQSSPPGYANAPAVPQGEMQAASGPSGPRAGFWQRFGAWLVDLLVLLVPSIIVVLLLGNTAVANLITTVIGLVYFTLLEGGPTGQTVGKRALGIRVIDFNSGGPIGYGRGIVRQLVKYISGLVLLLGYLWMLWDREKQTWHDKAANDVVAPVDAYPVQS